PYPPSLRRNGKYFGEVWMTVAFAPLLNPQYGSEHCEPHVDAHFGVYRDVRHRDGKIEKKFAGLVPPEHKSRGELYESYQVEKLRKWAPVRTYHARLPQTGERGERWRLKLQLLSRHEDGAGHDALGSRPQPFALILT